MITQKESSAEAPKLLQNLNKEHATWRNMYKLWAKKIKRNHLVDSIVVKNNEDISTSEKRDKCLKEICQRLDISVPIWLKKHDLEFSQFKYVTFYPQDFIDEIDFDKLEVELIDEENKSA